MCGISGYSGKFDPDLLARMNERLAHRGPDGAGLWTSSKAGIGLAHRRLTILDLSNMGAQPMWDATGTLVITYNGELYNFRELRLQLEKDGFSFRSESDTEVLLNLYLKHGVKMLPLLNGIFAFAIWDTREQELFLARDGIGVKPLYYAAVPQGFLFASELKALLEEESVDRGIDPNALASYLTYLYCPAPNTLFRSIKKLEPGQAMLVSKGKISREWKFYDLPYAEPPQEIAESEAIERVRHSVREAVRRQMVADVPVGAFLSGGLDSSSVVAFAREFSAGSRFQCFTIGYRGTSWDKEGMAEDLPYAQQVASYLDVDLHTVEVGTDFSDHLERAIYQLEEPQADPAIINVLLISELARRNGVKVLLSGTGGDDIFTGYRRHLALSHEWTWSWLPREARRLLARVASSVPTDFPTGRRVNKAFLHADLDGDHRIVSYFYWAPAHVAQNILHPQIRDAITEPVSAPMLRALSKLRPDTDVLNKMLYLDGKFFLGDHNLNYTDKMGMAAGVEIRVPLLDQDLVSLATSLPLRLKQHGNVGKYVFKRAMEGYLPREVIYRPKTGFGVPLRGWLRNELRPLLEDILSPDALVRSGLFDSEAVRRLLADDRRGKIDGTYTVLAVLCIELWYRMFIEQKCTPSVSSSSIR